MHPLLNIAVKIARSTGSLLCREFDRLGADENDSHLSNLKNNLEMQLVEQLSETHSKDGIVFPNQKINETAENIWFIDVLSGEENFARGIPHFAICIAIQCQDKIEHALIYDPLLDETFFASRSGHTQRNKFRVRISSKTKALSNSVLAGNDLSSLALEPPQIRQTGCNALMLAYVASGRYDGFIGKNLSPFELAAGSLLIKSAGGLSTDLSGGNDHIVKGELVAANANLLKTILKEIRGCQRPIN
jgi:myo-inositol-1(or 4)-monophosphatase